jgi:dolichol-phosphate mannosyltransferase
MANEGTEAVRFVREVLEQCKGLGNVRFFAVLDKVTTDNTLDLLREYAKTEPRLRVVWAPENRCVVDAYIRGYREALAAGSDWILEIDAGFSHRPADIPQFFAAMQQGYDCVFGSRCGTILTNLMMGTRLSDMTSGFEMFSRRTLQGILETGIRSRAHFFQTEIKVYCRNLKITEVPIQYQAASPRLHGSAVKEALTQLWRLYRNRARQVSGKTQMGVL